MGNARKWILGMSALGLILLTGCTASSTGTAGSPSATRTAAPTRTQTPSPTVTPTATIIPTVLPMVTPSPGPAPEFEIINVSIHNGPFSDFFFMAEMKNNSDDSFIFNEREVGLLLQLERWWESGYFYHALAEVALRPLSGVIQSINCILLPGETGVIAFGSRAIDIGKYTSSRETIEGPLPFTGARLIGYTPKYRSWKVLQQQYPFNQKSYGYPDELENLYHPEAENLVFRIDGAKFTIEYDVEIVFPDYGTQDPLSWIILYDSADRIVNVLSTRPIYCDGVGCFTARRYHLFGVGSNARVPRNPTIAPGQFTDWWEPVMELTVDQLQQVDHIRVLNELQNNSMCLKPLA